HRKLRPNLSVGRRQQTCLSSAEKRDYEGIFFVCQVSQTSNRPENPFITPLRTAATEDNFQGPPPPKPPKQSQQQRSGIMKHFFKFVKSAEANLKQTQPQKTPTSTLAAPQNLSASPRACRSAVALAIKPAGRSRLQCRSTKGTRL